MTVTNYHSYGPVFRFQIAQYLAELKKSCSLPLMASSTLKSTCAKTFHFSSEHLSK